MLFCTVINSTFYWERVDNISSSELGSVSNERSGDFKDEFLLLPLSNLFLTSIKFENLIEFEFSREKL